MESLANPIFRSVRLPLATVLGLLICLIALPCSAQQDTAQQDTEKVPFDLLNQPIDNLSIYIFLEKNAALQKARQAEDAAEVIKQQLESAKRSSDLSLDSLTSHPVVKQEDLYPHMVKSCLYLGLFYNCGKCDRSHVSLSGGVVISESGLVLTNYHVLEEKKQGGTTEGFMAMTHDGKCFEVEKVLAADKVSDIALVQLKANGHKFHAAPLAKIRPAPLSKVNLISHPSGEFFILTTGVVSRYSNASSRKDRTNARAAWMEITADFGGGSSGCGVFNEAGEVIGVASRIRPINRAASKSMRGGKEITRPAYVEMLIRRCADLDAINKCFANPDSDSESDSTATATEEQEPTAELNQSID